MSNFNLNLTRTLRRAARDLERGTATRPVVARTLRVVASLLLSAERLEREAGRLTTDHLAALTTGPGATVFDAKGTVDAA